MGLMPHAAGNRVGRPPKTSKQQILDTAVLFDPTELQLTALAKQLGISVKTVYYYFPTRKSLLHALTERAVAEIGLPHLDGLSTWREILAEAARWSYQVGVSDPDGYLNTAGLRGVTLRAAQHVLDRLTALGVSETAGFNAFITVATWAMAAGASAHRTRTSGGLSAENVERHVSEYFEPHVADRLQRLMVGVDLEDHFRTGLEILLAGVADYLA